VTRRLEQHWLTGIVAVDSDPDRPIRWKVGGPEVPAGDGKRATFVAAPPGNAEWAAAIGHPSRPLEQTDPAYACARRFRDVMYPEEFEVEVVEGKADVGSALARVFAPVLFRQSMLSDRWWQGVTVFAENEHMVDSDVGHSMFLSLAG